MAPFHLPRHFTALRQGSLRVGQEVTEATGGRPRQQKTGLQMLSDARVASANTLLDRAYGKAPTFSTTDPGTFKRAIDMTDDELAAIVSSQAYPT